MNEESPMTAHSHAEIVPGCFRCELAVDEAIAAATRPETDTQSGGACLDCHRRYGDEHGFPDLNVPDTVWEVINPGSNGGGLLCPSCICARAHDAGIRSHAYFASGPFRAVGL